VSSRNQIMAPIKKGEILGTLKVMNHHKLIKKQMLHALRAIRSGNWYKQLFDSVVLFFGALLHSLFSGAL